MLGVILDAFGVPAAAMRIAAPGRLEVVAANSALEATLGCDPGALAGQPAAALLPEAGRRLLGRAGRRRGGRDPARRVRAALPGQRPLPPARG